MPLEQRVIAPIWVSRGCFELNQHHPHHQPGTNQQVNVANELECVTNGTLSNIIRQLSSLSRHAEDLFGSILQETTGLVQRSVSLKQRLDVLTDKVERLSDAGADQPGGTIGKKPYRSRAENFDQQIVARTTMPVSLKEVYERCDPPPSLSKLNSFRDDDLDGVTLYTNPNYFFDLWKKEMLSGKSKATKKDPHTSSAKKSKSRSNSSRQQSVDSGQAMSGNIHYHVQQQQQHSPHPVHSQMIMNQGPNSRTSFASGDMPYGIYSENNGGIVHQQQQQQAHALQQQKQIYGQIPAQNHLYGYQGQGAHGTYENNTYNDQNNIYNQQQNRPNSLELSQQQQQQQQYYQMEYYKQQQQQQQQQQYGVYGANQQPIYGQNNHYQQQQNSPNQLGTPTKRGGAVSRPSVAPPAPPPGAPGSQPSTPIKNRMMNGNIDGGAMSSRDSLPPPPPPPMMADEMPPPPPPIQMGGGPTSGPPPPPPMPTGDVGFAPPPPPPPPPPVSNNNGPSMPVNVPKKQPASSTNLSKPTAEMLLSVKLKKTEPKASNPGYEDDRSNLLAAIRQGIKLKRVEENRKEIEKSKPPCDVASILARRMAIEVSDDEDEDKDGEDDDSDGWEIESN